MRPSSVAGLADPTPLAILLRRVDRQSAAATALWMASQGLETATSCVRRPGKSKAACPDSESGFPPHSKTLARSRTALSQQLPFEHERRFDCVGTPLRASQSGASGCIGIAPASRSAVWATVSAMSTPADLAKADKFVDRLGGMIAYTRLVNPDEGCQLRELFESVGE